MEALDYSALYRVQDQVLKIFFGADTAFYLTGGTCLNRFFFEKRYSADLDLFSNQNNLFREDVRLPLVEALSLARRYSLTVYDAAFLSLAMERKAELLTGDEQMKNAFEESRLNRTL
ncbi:MAG: type II toxin-antitoxin system VapC family toxin [Deltaproteobacteria bacterium]|nr:type II toxin-antitoxin system VapC family toxin [Deltaproteobacteria bacterium]